MDEKLTDKQRAFILEYPIDFNATQAAIRAGYSPKTARQAGTRLLSNVYIQENIELEFKDRVMSLNEVLLRLSKQAISSIGDFIDEHGAIDWKIVKAKGHLIRKITHHKDGRSTIELHDSQAALVHLGRYYSLFKDRLLVEEWRSEIIKLLREGAVTPEMVVSELGKDLAHELFRSAGIAIIEKPPESES